MCLTSQAVVHIANNLLYLSENFPKDCIWYPHCATWCILITLLKRICSVGAPNFIIAGLCSPYFWTYVCKYGQSMPPYREMSLTCWVICSVYLQHLHSWCLQRSRHTKGGEQWFFLQASEEQPMETPCDVTTCSLSEACSWSRGMEWPLNLKSRKQPGDNR